MHITRWITEAADTLRIWNIFGFSTATDYANASHCYIYTYIACLVLTSQRIYWPCCALWTKPKQSSEII